MLTRDAVVAGSVDSHVTARAAVRHKFAELSSLSIALDTDALYK